MTKPKLNSDKLKAAVKRMRKFAKRLGIKSPDAQDSEGNCHDGQRAFLETPASLTDREDCRNLDGQSANMRGGPKEPATRPARLNRPTGKPVKKRNVIEK